LAAIAFKNKQTQPDITYLLLLSTFIAAHRVALEPQKDE